MANTYELTSELASLHSDWHELERACGGYLRTASGIMPSR